tara:strand:+ start:325 stop:516 length:192 start_codon:yes stop_codon:yes gene_type:complete
MPVLTLAWLVPVSEDDARSMLASVLPVVGFPPDQQLNDLVRDLFGTEHVDDPWVQGPLFVDNL